MNFFLNLFDTSDFPQRWYCGEWSAGHGWLHILSDVGIWAAYFAIPGLLAYFLSQRKDIPFRRVFLLFVAFIMLCGLTHLMDAIIFWWPAYRLSGLLKLSTAIVSWGTVVALIYHIPEVLRLRSPEELEREIEARKQAEQALRESNDILEQRVQERVAQLDRANAEIKERDARWRRFVSSNIIGVGLADADGSWLEVNGELLRMLRCSDEEWQKEGLRWYDMTPPEYLPRDVEGIETADKEGACPAYEKEYIAKDGTRVPITLGYTPVEDRPGQYICFVLDQSRLKETEQALKQSQAEFFQLADAIPQMAWMTRADGYVDWFNHRWYEYTGLSQETCLGWNWKECIEPEDLPQVQAAWEKSIATGQRLDIVAQIRGADGVVRPFLTRALPLKNEDGQIVRWFGTNTDISEQQQIQEELRTVAAQLSDADRKKDEFLATLAHELRNPLAPIRMGLELMKMAGDDPELLDETRETMERQTKQLITLVDDLLDVSRVTRGKLNLRKADVKISDVIQSAVETAQPLIEDSEHTLEVVIDSDITIHADPHRLAQVVSNLLNNAAKYTPDGGKITLWVEQPSANQVAIHVRDTGIGIPADMIDCIFTIFTQVDRSMERSFAGLGIGLTLVKSLVEMHGGTISVTSQGQGQGSEFTATLPVREEDQPTQNQDLPIESFSLKKGKHKVLVVDDNKAAAEMLSKVVKMLGNTVETAEDGQQAIEVAQRFRPEIILMDLGMPKMNGYEAARHIRQQDWGKDVLLIALTGWGQQEDRDRTKDAGFDHHLVKPAEPSELQRIINQGRQT
ncbi:Autoinducer 2 sensor kinase/phosphatase LuxQ [Bremerella volcania]|uniref:histidine kinase n=1 Tax=Bremerella volcania TaxID=2527984 RepID=A0A518C1E8_9BACT|nr:ATP-binding protein [Bremerella volcania]QDU73043.1 Autoinducer 2 sensor kinase/phosphatase LuxQ [Bremerella volcania]